MNCKCELCAEIGGQASRFGELYGELLSDRLVDVGRHFIVMPSIGQLGDGHLMIVSRAHLTAAAHLGWPMREEIVASIHRVRDWMRQSIGPSVFVFENGDPQGDGHMNCSISHLHVHVVASRLPVPNFRAAIQSLGAESLAGLPAAHAVSGAYSWVEFSPNDALLVPRRLPSQTLRRLFAEELGVDRWDWREAGREWRLINLVRAARAGLTGSHESEAA